MYEGHEDEGYTQRRCKNGDGHVDGGYRKKKRTMDTKLMITLKVDAKTGMDTMLNDTKTEEDDEH